MSIVSASDDVELSDSSNMISVDDNSVDSSVSDSDGGSAVDESKLVPADKETVEKSGIETKANSVDANKKSTKLSVKKLNTYYKEKSNLNIYLKDSNNKAIKNKLIKVSLNGKTYSKRTDYLGKVTLNLKLKPNRYNVKIAFGGDNEYKSSSINNVVNVRKAPLLVKTGNAKVYYHPDTFFKAKVINKVTKNPVEGIRVLFKVYSSKSQYKYYHGITNKKGIATLNKRLKTGSYYVCTSIKDNIEKSFISYRNSNKKVSLRVMDIREIGCSSIYVRANENESAIAFRRDSTYAADLYIVAKRWYGRYAIKQYKVTGSYFFHAITTSDGWLIGTGGWDDPTVNKNIESLAGKIVSSNSLSSSLLNSIKGQEAKLNTGHFAIVAPNGRYAVIWKNTILRGKLQDGEFLDVPNLRAYFRKGNFSQFSNNTAKAALRIAATDTFGVNRRNIMVYRYKRTTKNYKTSSYVNVYGSNDKGNLVGRYTAGLKDNVYFKGEFISKNSLSGTPNMKFIGVHKFGNIDKLFKTPTRVYSPNITRKYNRTTYLKVLLKHKKTGAVLKGVKINLKIFTGKAYENFVVVTDKKGIARFNTKNLSVGNHRVVISPANHKHIISGSCNALIKG